jgi:hypothetical protein
VSRVIQRVLPRLAQAGRDTMRLPDPGKKRRRTLDALRAALPEVVVIIDRFEQRVQRPEHRQAADDLYRGHLQVDTNGLVVAIQRPWRHLGSDIGRLTKGGAQVLDDGQWYLGQTRKVAKAHEGVIATLK